MIEFHPVPAVLLGAVLLLLGTNLVLDYKDARDLKVSQIALLTSLALQLFAGALASAPRIRRFLFVCSAALLVLSVTFIIRFSRLQRRERQEQS